MLSFGSGGEPCKPCIMNVMVPHAMSWVGEVETPHAAAGEVRVKLATSGVNPSDVKSRLGTTRRNCVSARDPHSDGAGVIDKVGAGVSKGSRRRARLGLERPIGNGRLARPPNLSALPAARPYRSRTKRVSSRCLPGHPG